ncbi:putative calpain [Aspergillus heteromorphus CBS 117.55]|uniref:Putative calpain n=1 Tax=Aspergillus heteromorphus CBS 117.55 TaxID=1448321 RepID=A0A317VXI0_9EURO|nr:putative calpain [Aspergillus heteromorphus CBS 117.55]PWY78339.1 putative calpain [Aspergillus heteromorphus CBS 117.55]
MECEDHLDMVYTPPPSSRSESNMRGKAKQAPQDTMKQFWDDFNSKFPGLVNTVLPDNPYARMKAARTPKGVIQGHHVGKSYEQAQKECQRAVERIARECERLNQKYCDPHFDIEVDLKCGRRSYLDGLFAKNQEMCPRGVKRVTEIFEKPQFYVNGPTASDVRQGRDGDCWFMAALCTMGNKEGLIEKICVARNELVGVYGFVFYRDGEWQQCIVDDKLYLRAADYDESVDERPIWDDINRIDTEEEYRKAWQTGSRALYFAQCVDENETWLPLLEKAYAKAHGDYSAIEGGFVGEALEDLTGGVTSDILTSNILDKDRFWKEELMQVNKEFLFGCGTGLFSNWLDPDYRGPPRDREGISENHSYSIMDAREVDGQRLLRLRNPWGKKEWTGAWSDGSEQWTPEWMAKLGHKFGNDGFFWISYEDLLKKYQHFDRIRLFNEEWTVTQQWTTLNVPWSADYHSTKFVLDVTKAGPVVIVLSQLDDRYYKGLAGEYEFVLKFRLQKEGEDDYFVRSHSSELMCRNVNVEVELEAGRYHILMKVTAYRNGNKLPTEEAVRRLAPLRREKLLQIGLSYDLAHAKGIVQETEKEKRAREEREERRKAAERRKLRDEIKKSLQKEWIRERKLEARRHRIEARLAAKPHIRMDVRKVEPERVIPDGPVQLPSDMHNGSSDGLDLESLEKGSTTQMSFHASRDSGSHHLRTSLPIRDHHSSKHSSHHDTEYLEGFEFDSDVDMPPDDHIDIRTPARPSCSSDTDANSDPWNAVCVVGLRVYSKDSQLSLEVLRPVHEDDVEASLDMDDPAASATLEMCAI